MRIVIKAHIFYNDYDLLIKAECWDIMIMMKHDIVGFKYSYACEILGCLVLSITSVVLKHTGNEQISMSR